MGSEKEIKLLKYILHRPLDCQENPFTHWVASTIQVLFILYKYYEMNYIKIISLLKKELKQEVMFCKLFQ